MTPSANYDNALCISYSGRLIAKFTVPADAMREYGEVEVQLHQFLTYDLNGGAVSFRLRPLYPRGKSPQYPQNTGTGEPYSRS
jgi:hypothetical protein